MSIHVESVLSALETDISWLHISAMNEPSDAIFRPTNRFAHLVRDISWDRFGLARNLFTRTEWKWRLRNAGDRETVLSSSLPSWPIRCRPLKGHLPWIPNLVLVTSPHEGHTRYHLIPWARKLGIPVLAIDHGMPTINWPWLSYRGSMMGCDACAVWSEVNRDVNVRAGAPPELQIITGSPSIDGLSDPVDFEPLKTYGLDPEIRIILLLGTHRSPIKEIADKAFQKVIEFSKSVKNVQIVFKPHPVEIAQKSSMKFPNDVFVIEESSSFLSLVRHSSVIISPATSVVAAALACRIPFVNLIPLGSGAAEESELQILDDSLGKAVFGPDKLNDAVLGTLVADEKASNAAFTRFGYRSDGKNGARVASLVKHLALGGQAPNWKDPFP